MTKAKRKPTMVEAVAVKTPSVMLPCRAVRYCRAVRMDFTSSVNFPSWMKESDGLEERVGDEDADDGKRPRMTYPRTGSRL